ncbi:MAG: bifunctional oligoribonuclease/PAP phosphatase NrnA [Ignavibacteria bacterium]|nr:bifunctional oligoribonuclease/PAP phosphatase NrnA [Ignavibacteria bacterium]
MQSEYEACRKVIEQSQRFVLTTHANPDPDGIGSELALARFLVSKGKDAVILNHSATPFNCAFLDPDKKVLQFDPSQHGPIVSLAEAIFVLDANHPDRLESLKPFVLRSSATRVCIDHHPDKADFADLYLIDEQSTATGEILYHLMRFLDKEAMTSAIAEPLYTAIMTDTGSFRFPKTDAEVHRIIADLIDLGVDPASTYEQLYEQGSANRIRLVGQVLRTLQLAHDGRVAYLTVTKPMFEATDTQEEDTENFVTQTLSIRGVEIGLMFTELPQGTKVSFRSKGEVAVNKLAQEFGGNGHKNAAGARLYHRSLSEVIPSVVSRAAHYLI